MSKISLLYIRNNISASYHSNVIDHYENPRNVGKFNKKDIDVGTGLVGAPACIHEDTLIAVADGRRNVSVKN